MPDLLVRSVEREVVEYLDKHRRRGWGQTRASLIRGILDDWVRKQKALDIQVAEESKSVRDSMRERVGGDDG